MRIYYRNKRVYFFINIFKILLYLNLGGVATKWGGEERTTPYLSSSFNMYMARLTYYFTPLKNVEKSTLIYIE